MIGADALILHLNALQEALMPEGDTNFKGLLKKIEVVAREISQPIIIKEVGWGISAQTARQLFDAGVKAFDVAGAGGTSWSQVEMHRAKEPPRHASPASSSTGVSPLPTPSPRSPLTCPDASSLPPVASRSGVDIAKSIALGADLGGMAGPFLKAAADFFRQSQT